MDDLQKLRVLIPHWMEHNNEHASEFVEWAEKASQAGNTEVAELVQQAAEAMRTANHSLEHAVDSLGGALDVEHHHHHHDHHHE